MDEPGRQLRRIRERLQLKYRDVEEASQEIARERSNQEFSVGLSRLADIENKGTLPSLYRLYSLCAIYGLNFNRVLSWYGVNLDHLATDAAKITLRETRPIDCAASVSDVAEMPVSVDAELDLTKTMFLSPHIRKWGSFSLSMLGKLDLRHNRYAVVGSEDWFMYPILPPGSFIQIDESKRRLSSNIATHEDERPIYFVEHRDGYLCGWCTERNGLLIVQPHPGSNMPLAIFRYPGEVDIVGQVVGVAKRLDSARRRHIHS